MTWAGNFPASMGLVYNGAFFGNIPTGIATTFDSPVYGVGAYVQFNYLTIPYYATLTLFDANYQQIDSIRLADSIPFTTVWLSLSEGTQDVWAAQFDVTPTPEPGTLVMLGTSALGLASVLRRRFKGVL